jgi:hypothetical protein
LNGNGGWDFGWRKNHDARNEGLEEAAEMKTRGAPAEQDGRTERDAVSDEALESFQDAAQRCGCAAGSALEAWLRVNLPLEFLFDRGIESEHLELAVVAEKRVHERAAEGLAHGFDEGDLGFIDGRGF